MDIESYERREALSQAKWHHSMPFGEPAYMDADGEYRLRHSPYPRRRASAGLVSAFTRRLLSNKRAGAAISSRGATRRLRARLGAALEDIEDIGMSSSIRCHRAYMQVESNSRGSE
jgi:hypothetical protein